MTRTRTRADLTEAVYHAVGLSRQESASLVERMLELVMQRLETGESVKLSSFGTFDVRAKAQRVGRNPKTGQEVAITPRRVLSFRASAVLKQTVNRRDDHRA
jgi:integration host factor subunit alpha